MTEDGPHYPAGAPFPPPDTRPPGAPPPAGTHPWSPSGAIPQEPPPPRLGKGGLAAGLVVGVVVFSTPGIVYGASVARPDAGLDLALWVSLVAGAVTLAAAITLVARTGIGRQWRGLGLGLLGAFGTSATLSPLGFAAGCLRAYAHGSL